MEIKADEISKIIREQIEEYKAGVEVSEIGSVISVGDGIARVYGLEKVMAGDIFGLSLRAGGVGLEPERMVDSVGVVCGVQRKRECGQRGRECRDQEMTG